MNIDHIGTNSGRDVTGEWLNLYFWELAERIGR